MKQLDKLMIRSFLGPFFVTFAIAMFVLMMQVLWLYLDDIAGKGLGFFLIMELLAYKCVGLLPLALPLSLLISSVMVLGSLAEHYELSSFKSAGVSLLRVMAALIVFGVLGGLASYATSDYLIPAANIQFGSRMYDIQQKKPTLNLEAGSFNEDFNQFAIHIGKKDSDGRHIKDVLIYDHTNANNGQLNEITAKEGEMYSANEGQYFVMKLYNGFQYSETSSSATKQQSLPYVRTAFKTYTKIFDLSEFKLQQTSRNLFTQNRSMMATWQLSWAVDSIQTDMLIRKQELSNYLNNYLPILPRDTVTYRAKGPVPEQLSGSTSIDEKIRQQRQPSDSTTAALPPPPDERIEPTRSAALNPEYGAKVRQNPLVTEAKEWQGILALYETLDEAGKTRVMNRVRSGARSILTQAESAIRILPGIRENKVKHIYDLNMKYSMALVCVIFIFIGAPMGAIVRKGGFGYPILVSIIFFVIFIILTIVCRKLAESFVLSGTLAGWMPCIVLAPVGVFLTIMARNDRKLGSLDGVRKIWELILSRFKKNAADADLTANSVNS